MRDFLSLPERTSSRHAAHYSPEHHPFSEEWLKHHPGAYHHYLHHQNIPHDHPYAWVGITWASIAAFVGLTSGPVAYDYGVYQEASSLPSDAEEVETARKLAETGEPKEDQDLGELLPLGVFAVTPPGSTESNIMIQLLINKDGIVTGSYYDVISDVARPVQGSLDRKTQRLAWTVGTNKEVTFDAGLENMTKDLVPVLVHFADSRTQKWTLIRLKDDRKDEEKAPARE